MCVEWEIPASEYGWCRSCRSISADAYTALCQTPRREQIKVVMNILLPQQLSNLFIFQAGLWGDFHIYSKCQQFITLSLI